MEDNFGKIYRVLGGKWKYEIFFLLSSGPKRFNQLKKSIKGISQKVLSQCLKSLEDDGLIKKTVYQENILHTEYFLTELGYRTDDILKATAQWNLSYEDYKIHSIDNVPFYIPNNNNLASYQERIKKAKEVISNADYILIGIGSGFSAQSGYNYRDENVAEKLFDRQFKKGFKSVYDMMSAYTNPQEYNIVDYWIFWSRYISLFIIDLKHSPISDELKKVIKEKQYHIITTNSDTQLINDGFEHNKIYEMLGNYSKLQCASACSEKLYESKPYVKKMHDDIKKYDTIRDISIPRCPLCGDYLIPNHVKQYNGIFFISSQYIETRSYFSDFLIKSKEKKTVYLELGSGLHLPEIIRYPFEKYTVNNPNATLIRINSLDSYVTNKNLNLDQVILFKEPMLDVLKDINKK